MALKSLVPWRRGELGPAGDPFALHREIDDLFERFFGGRELAPWPEDGFAPSVDMTETDKEIRVTADIPGMDEKEIELSIRECCLTIKGEKKGGKEEEEGSRHYVERTYGSFERRITLPCDVDADKARASCEKGVLTITLPKTAMARNVKKINVSSA